MKKRRKMWRRGLASALVCSLLLGMPGGAELTAAAAEGVSSAAESVSGQVKRLVAAATSTTYTSEDETWTLTVSDSGEVTNFTALDGFTGEVAIPATVENVTVVSIGKQAFQTKTAITAVTIPDTVTSIGEWAFLDCSNLKTLSLGTGVTSIGEAAFQNCALTTVTLPDGLTAIPDNCFHSCPLESVALSANLKTIGASAFSGANLTELVIPAGVTSIGGSAFANCKNLAKVAFQESSETSLTLGGSVFRECSALTEIEIPGRVKKILELSFLQCTALTTVTLNEGTQEIGQRAFDGCSSLTAINFPTTLTNIGGAAFQSCDFTEISIPATVTEYGAYNGHGYTFNQCNNLTTVTIASPHTATLMFTSCENLKTVVLEDSVTYLNNYAFQGCNNLSSMTVYNPNMEFYTGTIVSVGGETLTVYGYEDSTAQNWATTNGYNFVDLAGQAETRTLTAQVKDPEGNPITSGFTVNWYEGDSETALSGGSISGAKTDCAYRCEVVLDNNLAETYTQPEPQTVEAGTDDMTITFTLARKEQTQLVTVTGQVLDQTGEPLSGAQVTATPAQGNSITGVTGSDGRYTLQDVPAEAVHLRISLDGYYSRTLTLSLADAAEAGTYRAEPVTLYETVSDRIALEVTIQHAAAAGETARKEVLNSLGALTVSLTAGGTEISPADYEVQGTTIYFQPNVVQAGQTIAVAISDPSGQTVGTSAEVTLDESRMGSAALTLTEKGGFRLGQLTLPGQSNVLVFDSAGSYRTTYTARTGLESAPMDAGTYTLIFLQATPMLQSVPSLSFLNDLGLISGTDYAQTTATITDGVFSDTDAVTVPALSEDAFSYLESGSFSVNTTKPSFGTLTLFTAKFNLAEGHTAQNLQVHLPDGMQLVNGSVMLDNVVSTYTESEGLLTVPMSGKDAGVLRFYLSAATTGSASASAYLALTGGALQPLGTVTLEVAPVELFLPEPTSRETIIASGKAMPGSTVALYDNGEKMTTTTANAAGSWSCELPLAQPLYQYSYHFIQAEIRRDGLDPLRTEEIMVTYDETAANLTTITMYNQNHSGECETVLDFSQPKTTVPFYAYWPDHMNYTFQVAFDKNADQLETVTVVTRGGNGETIRIPASYDAESGTWVATYEFNEFNTPVSVGAEFDGVESYPLKVSNESFLDAAQQYEKAIQTAADRIQMLYADDVEDGDAEANTLLYEFQDASKDHLTMDILLPGSEAPLCRYTIQRTTDNRTIEQLKADRYNYLPEKEVYLKFSAEGFTLKTEFVSLTDGTCLVETYVLGGEESSVRRMRAASTVSEEDEEPSTWEVYQMLSQYVIDQLGELPVYGKFASLTQDILLTGSQQYNWRRQLNGNYESLWVLLNSVNTALNATCPDGSRKLNSAMLSDLRNVYYNLAIELEAYRTNGTLMINACLGLPTIQRMVTELIHDIVSGIGFGELDEWLGDAIGTAADAKDEILDMLEYRAELDGAMAEIEQLLDSGSFTDYITDKILSTFITESSDGNLIEVHFKSWSAKFYTEQGVENYLNSGFKEYYDRIMDLRSAVLRNYITCPGDGGGGGGGSGGPGSGGSGSGAGDNGDGGSGTLEDGGTQTDSRDVNPVHDPSGYVYEAVPSNRLEDVTATVYYLNKDNSETAWNAADYDQINPQITGADGSYAWFVPQGQWKVRFTKDGYTSTDSSDVPAAAKNTGHEGWLPVPPPQFEVNVGMVSNTAPAVEQATAYTDRIEVVFSQYMNIDSVKQAVKLQQDGADVNITVEPLDAEYNLDGTAPFPLVKDIVGYLKMCHSILPIKR